MATSAEILELREYINEPDDETPYDNTSLSSKIDGNGGDVKLTASQIWNTKASQYAELADVQEGSSRRALGSLYKQALAMGEYYQSVSSQPPESTVRRSRTRAIERM